MNKWQILYSIRLWLARLNVLFDVRLVSGNLRVHLLSYDQLAPVSHRPSLCRRVEPLQRFGKEFLSNLNKQVNKQIDELTNSVKPVVGAPY